jgi:hypothetical protein
MMRSVLAFVIIVVGVAGAQNASVSSRGEESISDSGSQLRPITWNEGVQVIETAWKNLSQFDSQIDCSHLVHEIYEQAGLRYPYSTSNELYRGIDEFERVREPQPADLIVWPGHVGLVVNPQEHSFYSALSTGLKMDSYDAPAWQNRGPARFFRFVMRPGERVRSTSSQSVATAQVAAAPLDNQSTTRKVASPIDTPRQARVTSTEIPDEAFLGRERPSSKEAIRGALLRVWNNPSEDRPDRWQQAQEIVIVESLKVQRIHLSGAGGTVEAKIRSSARITADSMDVHPSIHVVSFRLARGKTGWTLDDPTRHLYLSGNAAVVAVSERLAGIARENVSRSEQAQAAELLHSMLR